jgi:hypothetical protein
MAAPAARSLASRIRHAIAFVAIVWGIAATFVAFEVVALSGMDVALSFPDLFGNVLLPRAVTESTSCSVGAVTGTAEPRPPAAGLRDARVSAWLLGVSLGRDAIFRQYTAADSQMLEQTVSGMRTVAGRLGVPPPPVFHPVQRANANSDFIAFVEDDGSETARQLAQIYSPQTCEVFKLAAFWGYSELVRPMLPGEGAAFAMEIRHHAQRAGLPEALWGPMMQRVPRDAKADDVINQTTTLTNGVTTYLTEH